jgi:hypothetical protein
MIARSVRISDGRTRTALVVAHPGHELRVFGWLLGERPRVYVLTDGSTRTARSRIASTTALVERARATLGTPYATLTDANIYEALLDENLDALVRVGDELADDLVAHGITRVVADAAEGYNPAHDLCRILVNLAVRRLGPHADTYEFPLMGRPDVPVVADRSRALRLTLDDATFARKLAEARAYPEMQWELDMAVGSVGTEAFRVECLWSVDPDADVVPPTDPPYYELYGRHQVSAGVYTRAIGYREHVQRAAAVLHAALAPCRRLRAGRA